MIDLLEQEINVVEEVFLGNVLLYGILQQYRLEFFQRVFFLYFLLINLLKNYFVDIILYLCDFYGE